MKQRNKYDQIPSVLLDRLKHILVFADKTVDEIVGEETEILEKIIPRMFKVVQMVAIFSCDYVKRGKPSCPGLANADVRSGKGRRVGLFGSH